MLRRWCVYLLMFSSLAAWAGAKSNPVQPGQKSASTKLPITTSSAQARISFEKSMRDFEEYRVPETLQDLRAATKADPNFAQAFILLSRMSPDPAEQAATRTRAKQLAPKVSPSEQLLIRWLAGAQENNYVPAISAMNDLLAKYPQDQRLAYLAGDWLMQQQRYEQAVTVLERALTLYPDYAAALNDVAYGYADTGNFEKAFAAMDRYVALEPDQPNPHDSYGEILRMAGKLDAALEQYRMSIRIDPNFGSEVGVADTLALMGKEREAREEYDRAIVFAPSNADKVQRELQSAVTWIREDNRKQAERALSDVARHAHAVGQARLEAEAHRILGMYEPDPKAALKHLQAAQDVLREEHEISASDRDEERARILRVRATRLAGAQDMESASATVNQLETMAGTSRSQVIQLCYHGAAGAVLVAQGKFTDAIPHLEEGVSDPESMRLLWRAYSSTSAASEAQAIALKLSALNLPTVEQALVVPQFRVSLVSRAEQP
ncbi:MAG TPA: tetratricopeptide repeat protein [Terriglobales bacterium]|nr:tetratricopeptide repeat protein [Terriglobales bacterium]